MKKIAYVGFALFVLVGLFLMIAKPFSLDLNDTGQMVLGGLVITIGLWIMKPWGIPFSMGAAFLAFFLLVLQLSPSVVFSGFTLSALWTLIPALFFGYVLQKTGLGRRIALAVIKVFPPTYGAMLIAWALIGILLSILTPSITVRVAIVMPIAVHCAALFGLEKGSKGNSLLLLTAFSMAIIPGSGWFNGSLWGPIIQGLYESVPELQGIITFESWLQVAFLPMMMVTVLLLIGGYLILRPEAPLSKTAIAELKATKPEPMTTSEKATGIILITVFVLFVTSSLHGIPDAAVCLLALVSFFIFKVLEVREVSTGINWDLIIFLGMALSLGTVFAETGISEWLAGVVVPLLAPLAHNPWVFILVVAFAIFLWRFLDIALLIPTMAILVPILPAIAETYGINPLIWIPIFLTAGNAMFMAYQNMWALMSQSISGDRAWKATHLGGYGAVYLVACMIALALSVPLYLNSGLF